MRTSHEPTYDGLSSDGFSNLGSSLFVYFNIILVSGLKMEDLVRVALIFAASYCFGALLGIATSPEDDDESVG